MVFLHVSDSVPTFFKTCCCHRTKNEVFPEILKCLCLIISTNKIWVWDLHILAFCFVYMLYSVPAFLVKAFSKVLSVLFLSCTGGFKYYSVMISFTKTAPWCVIEFLPKSPSEENTQCLFLAHLTERLMPWWSSVIRCRRPTVLVWF